MGDFEISSAQPETPVTAVRPFDVIQMMFPLGTQYQELEEEVGDDAWDLPPNWPPDLFAATAYLLLQSGAYHHVTPGGAYIEQPVPNSTSDEIELELVITKDELKEIQEAAEIWRLDIDAMPDFIFRDWLDIKHADKRLSSLRDKPKTSLPSWWRAAIRLSMLADHTCWKVGHAASRDASSEWISLPMQMVWEELLRNVKDKDKENSEFVQIEEGMFSLCVAASRDMVCVLPKAKSPEIGCTIRSISQNLCLLPSAGVLEAGWQQVPNPSLGSPESSPFNVLMIPYPYFIEPSWFKVSGDRNHWQWFELQQRWLPRTEEALAEFFQFITKLIENAVETQNKPIHGIIFPEYALTWDVHEALAQHLKKVCKSIEFLISGSSSNCRGEKGNYVLTTQFVRVKDNGKSAKFAFTTSRAKHHRWKINPHQIAEYQLYDGFVETKPKNAYWEKIRLPRRRIHTNVFRDESVLSTLVCEDLARSEPSHQYLRALGPNIVFVLLMDGPQLGFRWPSRYALGLAEDPGAAVVTLTSRALVRQSNDYSKTQDRAESWAISITRNPDGAPVELECPLSAEAIFVSFTAEQSSEVTLDGRFQNDCWSWKIQNHGKKISLNRDNTQEKSLLQQFVRYYDV